MNPSPAGIEGQGKRPRMMDVGPVADVLMRQRQHGAGPQRVSGRQAAGDEAEVLAGVHQQFPDPDVVLALDEDLEPDLAGVAGSREQQGRPVQELRVAGERRRRVEVALEREVRQLVERGVRRLQDLLHDPDRRRSLDVDLPELVGHVDQLDVAGPSCSPPGGRR